MNFLTQITVSALFKSLQNSAVNLPAPSIAASDEIPHMLPGNTSVLVMLPLSIVALSSPVHCGLVTDDRIPTHVGRTLLYL